MPHWNPPEEWLDDEEMMDHAPTLFVLFDGTRTTLDMTFREAGEAMREAESSGELVGGKIDPSKVRSIGVSLR